MLTLLDTYDNFDLSSPFITLEYIVWPIFFGIVIASLFAVYNKRIIGAVVRALIKAGANSPESAKTLAEVGCERNIFVKLTLRHDSGVLAKFVRPVAAADAVATVEAEAVDAEKASGDSVSSPTQSQPTDAEAVQSQTINAAKTQQIADEKPQSRINVAAKQQPQPDEKTKKSTEKLTFMQWTRKFFTGEPYPKPTIPVNTTRFYVPENLTDRALIRYEKKGTDLFTVAATIIIFFIISLLAIKYIPQLITLLDDTITLFKEI